YRSDVPLRNTRVGATHLEISLTTEKAPRRFRRRERPGRPIILVVPAQKGRKADSGSGECGCDAPGYAVAAIIVARVTADEKRGRGVGDVIADPTVVRKGAAAGKES